MNLKRVLFKNQKKQRAKISYVVIRLLMSVIQFIRGFVFMRVLSLSDLGIITLISAVMGLFAMFQLGLLNGGYRIFSVDNSKKWQANDVIYSYFFIIFLLFLVGILIAFTVQKISQREFFFAVPALFFGLIMVFNNWNRNIFTAQQRFNEINRIEFISTIISFTFLFIVFYINIYGALIVIFSKELIFYLITILRNRNFLPRNFTLNFKAIKWVLKFGFLPFLAGAVITINLQVETWSIAGFLTTEELGKFYLPKLYIQLFLILPVAISQLFFAETMNEFVNENFMRVKKILKEYFIINILYSLFILILTWFFMKPVIEFAIPKHVVGIQYIWLILPGLLIYTILQPVDLIFNAAVKLSPFLWASSAALLITISTLLPLGFLDKLSLNYVALIKGFSYIIISVVLLGFYYYNRKSIWKVSFEIDDPINDSKIK